MMLTPLTEEGGIDVSALKRMVDFYIEKNITGLLQSVLLVKSHFDVKELRLF